MIPYALAFNLKNIGRLDPARTIYTGPVESVVLVPYCRHSTPEGVREMTAGAAFTRLVGETAPWCLSQSNRFLPVVNMSVLNAKLAELGSKVITAESPDAATRDPAAPWKVVKEDLIDEDLWKRAHAFSIAKHLEGEIMFSDLVRLVMAALHEGMEQYEAGGTNAGPRIIPVTNT